MQLRLQSRLQLQFRLHLQTDTVTVVRVFAENLVVLGFLQSASCIKSNPTQEKIFAVGKSGPNATFNLNFLGLDWPWVGEFGGHMILFMCFPTQQNMVNRKHPIVTASATVSDRVNIYRYGHSDSYMYMFGYSFSYSYR